MEVRIGTGGSVSEMDKDLRHSYCGAPVRVQAKLRCQKQNPRGIRRGGGRNNRATVGGGIIISLFDFSEMTSLKSHSKIHKTSSHMNI